MRDGYPAERIAADQIGHPIAVQEAERDLRERGRGGALNQLERATAVVAADGQRSRRARRGDDVGEPVTVHVEHRHGGSRRHVQRREHVELARDRPEHHLRRGGRERDHQVADAVVVEVGRHHLIDGHAERRQRSRRAEPSVHSLEHHQLARRRGRHDHQVRVEVGGEMAGHHCSHRRGNGGRLGRCEADGRGGPAGASRAARAPHAARPPRAARPIVLEVDGDVRAVRRVRPDGNADRDAGGSPVARRAAGDLREADEGPGRVAGARRHVARDHRSARRVPRGDGDRDDPDRDGPRRAARLARPLLRAGGRIAPGARSPRTSSRTAGWSTSAAAPAPARPRATTTTGRRSKAPTTAAARWRWSRRWSGCAR